MLENVIFFFFQAEDGIRDDLVTGVQTCALPICENRMARATPQKMAPMNSQSTAPKPMVAAISSSMKVRLCKGSRFICRSVRKMRQCTRLRELPEGPGNRLVTALLRCLNGGTMAVATRPFLSHSRIRQSVQPCRGRFHKPANASFREA